MPIILLELLLYLFLTYNLLILANPLLFIVMHLIGQLKLSYFIILVMICRMLAYCLIN